MYIFMVGWVFVLNRITFEVFISITTILHAIFSWPDYSYVFNHQYNFTNKQNWTLFFLPVYGLVDKPYLGMN